MTRVFDAMPARPGVSMPTDAQGDGEDTAKISSGTRPPAAPWTGGPYTAITAERFPASRRIGCAEGPETPGSPALHVAPAPAEAP